MQLFQWQLLQGRGWKIAGETFRKGLQSVLFLWKAYNKVAVRPRCDLLFRTKPKRPSEFNTNRLIMHFSKQHQKMWEIIQRHWSLLTDDPKTHQFILNAPSITYRRALSVKDHLVTSEFKGETIKENCPAKGSFPCGHCSQCPLIKKEKSFSLPNGENFEPLHFVNCRTRGLDYVMFCECQALYIGKTRQEFSCRIAQYIYSMQIGNLHLPLGRQWC